jgi:hypothetical protein
MTTYHNSGDPVGRRHPINPQGTSNSQQRSLVWPVVFALLVCFAAGYALFSNDTDPHGPHLRVTPQATQ